MGEGEGGRIPWSVCQESRLSEKKVKAGGPSWHWFGGLALGSVVLFLFFRGVSLPEVGEAIKEASLPLVGLALILNLLALSLWAAQWRVLLPRGVEVSLVRMQEVVCITAMVQNTVPLWGGHAVAVALLARRGGTGIGAAVSVLAADQLLKGIIKLGLLFLVALALPLPPGMARGAWSLLLAVVLLGGVLLAVARFPASGRGRGRSGRIVASFRSWGHHLDVLRHPGHFSRALALGFGQKGLEWAAILAVQAAFGVASPGGALLVLVAVVLASVLPVSPGNLGVFEAGALLAYAALGVPTSTAVLLAVLHHGVFLLPHVGAGYGILLYKGLSLGGLKKELTVAGASRAGD